MPEHEERANQRVCPYCENPFDSQGLYLHVRNTGDEHHEEAGSVPDEFDPREAPIHDPEGDEEVIETDLGGEADEMDYTEQNKLYRCLYCGRDQKGKGALSIHLTKSAGDEMHPEDASTDDEMYFTVPADENWNPIMDEDQMDDIERRELRNRRVSDHLPGAESIDEAESSTETENMQAQQRTLTSAEVEQRKEEIVIPRGENKTVQVAAVLTQEPRFYDRPDIVEDMVNCSTTTFYEGRKLYDNSGGVDVDSPEVGGSESEQAEEAESESEDGLTVMVGDQKFVPFDALEEVAEATSEAAEEIVNRYR